VRVIFFTGKGGVGKTTVAAATSAQAAARGHKILVMSTDAAHSLSDVLAEPLGADPREISPGLFAQQVDTDRRLQESWTTIRSYLTEVLVGSGVDELVADELAMLPGLEQLLALLELRDQLRSGRFDVIAVDCAPTAETLRLLALPDVLGWYLERLFPPRRVVARALRPLVGRLLDPTGDTLPDAAVVTATDRLQQELLDVKECLGNAHTTVRLVLTPEAVVLAEAQRLAATLALFDYPVDGVVMNRLLPSEVVAESAWLRAMHESQEQVMGDVEVCFADAPLSCVDYRPQEPRGLATIEQLGEQVYGDKDPVVDRGPDRHPSVERADDGYVVVFPVANVPRGELALSRVGDELVVAVGAFRRVWTMPSAIRRCDVRGASLTDRGLEVVLVPLPAEWPGDRGSR